MLNLICLKIIGTKTLVDYCKLHKVVLCIILDSQNSIMLPKTKPSFLLAPGVAASFCSDGF